MISCFKNYLEAHIAETLIVSRIDMPQFDFTDSDAANFAFSHLAMRPTVMVDGSPYLSDSHATNFGICQGAAILLSQLGEDWRSLAASELITAIENFIEVGAMAGHDSQQSRVLSSSH